MLGQWLPTFTKIKHRLTTSTTAPKTSANFIKLHYSYIIAWTLLSSVILYGNGRIPYVDALFFASGAATQSGLNTIDVNKLALYQQVVIMLVACVCNPIFIHTSVVFVRLYWFEKRFQDVVRGSQMKGRRTQSPPKRKWKSMEDVEGGMVNRSRGVGNREIRVLRGSSGHAYGGYIENEFAFNDGQDRTGDGIRVRRHSNLEEPDRTSFGPTAARHEAATDETVAEAKNPSMPAQPQDGLPASLDPPVACLPQASHERSIAFMEAQRNPSAKGTLRIPGPRDFDLGHIPEKVEDGDGYSRKATKMLSYDSDLSRYPSTSVPTDEKDDEAHSLKHHVTIDVPDRPRRTAGVSAYNRTRTVDADASIPHPTMQLRSRSRSRTFTSFLTGTRDEDTHYAPYLSWTPTIGRNSNFVDLTEEQREELGGIEYRALKLLAIILVCFFVGFHLFGMVCLTPWINGTAQYRAVVQNVGISPTWWGFFTAASLFNDLGFTLTPDSMISFQQAVFPLVLGTFLIIIGNTGFPCMLRFVIWATSKCVPESSSVWEELRFLLDHPRRCFTLLFPSKTNWLLFWILVLLNGIDLMFFIVLDLNDPTVTSLPPGFQFLAGLFQAASTRTAGFSVVNLPELHPAVQVSYMIMMYISVFPIAMSIRQSNVYEERSLGIWPSGDYDESTQSSYLSHHLRRQLSFDLWYVFLGLFLIAIIEGSRLDNTNEYAFNLFAVLFEIVSAYGTVGLSQGFPGFNTSFSGQFRTLSKLIIIAMQIRGRHRGLPYGLDRAILLPSESLHQKENEDATLRARCASNGAGTGIDGVSRTNSGLSSRTENTFDPANRGIVFQVKQIERRLAGAFRAGPTAPLWEKRA